MLHLRSFTRFSIHLESWNAFRFCQSNKFWKKSLKKLDIQVWVLSRSSRGRPENVLGTSRINLPGTSLERQIKTSPGRHFRTTPGRLIGTSLGRSNRIFRGRPRDVGGGRPGDQYLPAGFRVILTLIIYLKPLFSLNNSSNNFFMLFLLTDNESLKFLLLIFSSL